jgi:non-specific serine/threonine protein kinase
VGTAATTRKEIGNLPLELTSFVDREEQLAEARGQLAISRLVTLIGMGGVGKTRIAVRVAREVRADLDDGAWLVRLDLLEDPAMLAQAVAGKEVAFSRRDALEDTGEVDAQDNRKC